MLDDEEGEGNGADPFPRTPGLDGVQNGDAACTNSGHSGTATASEKEGWNQSDRGGNPRGKRRRGLTGVARNGWLTMVRMKTTGRGRGSEGAGDEAEEFRRRGGCSRSALRWKRR